MMILAAMIMTLAVWVFRARCDDDDDGEDDGDDGDDCDDDIRSAGFEARCVTVNYHDTVRFPTHESIDIRSTPVVLSVPPSPSSPSIFLSMHKLSGKSSKVWK